jgi:hypothetical protein
MDQTMSKLNSQIIEELFKINNIRTAIIGGTFVGLDPAIGGVQLSNSVNMDSSQFLNLYAELSELEKEQGNPFDYVGLSTLWNTGFSTPHEKISTPDFFSGNSTKYLKNRKIRTADQLFSRRSESSIASLFGCFKFKGKNKIIDWSGGGVDNEEFIRYALICNRWISHPQTIHYVTSIKGDGKSRDYLYLIGGDSSFFFEPKKLIDEIIKTNKTILLLQDQIASNPKSVPNDIRNLADNLSSDEKIWVAENLDNKPKDVLNHQLIELSINIRKISRISHGVFSFYNYLIHAHKHLNLVNIYETDEETLGKPVRIVYLLKEYEPVYTHCKNLCLCSIV